MKITVEGTKQIYSLAQKVYHKESSIKQAIRIVASNELMAESSAKIYINIFKDLMVGVAHKRAMNEFSTLYFLESIYADYGRKQFVKAIHSTTGHVDYYNSLGKGRRASISNVIKTLCTKYKVGDELNNFYPNEVQGTEFIEGAVKSVRVNVYERDVNARSECIAIYGMNCVVCDFNFEKAYGDLGIGFIHVHHLVDLASIGHSYKVDPKADLRPVCPNCHAMLHKIKPAYSIEELKNKLKRIK